MGVRYGGGSGSVDFGDGGGFDSTDGGFDSTGGGFDSTGAGGGEHMSGHVPHSLMHSKLASVESRLDNGVTPIANVKTNRKYKTRVCCISISLKCSSTL